MAVAANRRESTMPEKRIRTSVWPWIAALGIGSLAFAEATSVSRCAGDFEPDSPHTLRTAHRNLVQLPSPAPDHVQASLPKPSSTPYAGPASELAGAPSATVEAMPTEDPYAG